MVAALEIHLGRGKIHGADMVVDVAVHHAPLGQRTAGRSIRRDVITVFGTGNAEAGRDARVAQVIPELGGTPIEVLVVVKPTAHWPCALPVTQL